MRNVLFVCSQNRLRSPTAEQMFSARDDLDVASAGTNRDAKTPLSTELIQWADLIVVMEKTHRTKVQRDYRKALNGKRIVCLDIPDNFAFMDPGLVELLQARMSRHLPMQRPGSRTALTLTTEAQNELNDRSDVQKAGRR